MNENEYIAVVVSFRQAGMPNLDSSVMMNGVKADVRIDISGWYKVRSEVIQVTNGGDVNETDTVVLFARPRTP